MSFKIAHICIPIAGKHCSPDKYRKILKMKESLLASLKRLPKTCKVIFDIKAIINGPFPSSNFPSMISRALAPLASNEWVNQSVVLTHDEAGKIPAVNRAIKEAKEAQGLIILDDDILIPQEALTEVVAFLWPSNQHFEALCFPKACINYKGLPEVFAGQLQFLFHPSTQRVLTRMGFFEVLRPSGSFYAIHKDHLIFFPDPCNEADILQDRKILISPYFIRTWYPESFVEEVSRRKKHIYATRNCPIPIKSTKPFETLSKYEELLLSVPKQLPANIQKRLYTALLTMKTVIQSAEAEYQNDPIT